MTTGLRVLLIQLREIGHSHAAEKCLLQEVVAAGWKSAGGKIASGTSEANLSQRLTRLRKKIVLPGPAFGRRMPS
jgi:hypothetical protein